MRGSWQDRSTVSAEPTREGSTTGSSSTMGHLSELYQRHLPGAVGLAFLILADRALAEDVAQEAFVRLAGRFGHLRAPDAFDAYLKRTVVNLCFSHLRHVRVERAYLDAERARPARGGSDPPDVAQREELWQELQRLPPRQRAAVVLRFYEDLSERQVADLLGTSVLAVRSLVTRGMEALRARIRGDGDG
jgi:RNA polymerase sigma-70 factor (sigma-E family)